MNSPTACHPRAYHHFTAQIPRLNTIPGLQNAAVAISMHTLHDIDVELVDQCIGDIARRVRQRVRSQSSTAVLAHLHEELFTNLGFTGNHEDYYCPENSFLPIVLERRTGIPISLSLVYVLVARRVGLQAEGVNAPGHFLARVHTTGSPLLVDPFLNGSILTTEEAFQRIGKMTGRSVAQTHSTLETASHQQWIIRMLNNLVNSFSLLEEQDNVAAMGELLELFT